MSHACQSGVVAHTPFPTGALCGRPLPPGPHAHSLTEISHEQCKGERGSSVLQVAKQP